MPGCRMDETVELSVEALVSDGRGLARRDGFVFLVEDALPGQTVQARVLRVRSRLADARTARTVVPSPDECPASCPHSACGGCEWQRLKYPSQLKWKARLVRDALERIGHISNPPVLPVLASPLQWGFRNKTAYALAGGGNEPLRIGMRRRRSRDVVDVTQCLLQSTFTMRVLAALRAVVPDTGLAARDERTGRGYWRFVVLRESGEDRLVEIITGPHPSNAKAAARLGERLGSALRREVPEITGFVLSERTSAVQVAQGERVRHKEGKTCVHTRLAGLQLEWNCRTFFQVNTGAAEILCRQAHDLLMPCGTEILWDLYCGVGGIGLSLAPHIRELYGMESSKSSVLCARKNAEAATSIRRRFEIGDAADAFHCFPAPDMVVADPPRAGMEPRVIAGLLQLVPNAILYVSCNPATLARDAALLLKAYRLEAVQPLDMFPQTPHVETLALFKRR